MPAADYYMPWYTFSHLSGRIVCSRRNTLARGTWYVDGGGGGGGDNRARGIMPHICTAAHPPATEVVLIVRGRTLYIPIFQAARHYLAQRNAALAVEPRLERPGQRSGSHDVVRHECTAPVTARERHGASTIWAGKTGSSTEPITARSQSTRVDKRCTKLALALQRVALDLHRSESCALAMCAKATRESRARKLGHAGPRCR